jgi:hypothetical protein
LNKSIKNPLERHQVTDLTKELVSFFVLVIFIENDCDTSSVIETLFRPHCLVLLFILNIRSKICDLLREAIKLLEVLVLSHSISSIQNMNLHIGSLDSMLGIDGKSIQKEWVFLRYCPNTGTGDLQRKTERAYGGMLHV